ncbi:MAG: peptidoglycan-associated lipoprotein Pal, partial [Burkholderiaceae bacterium]
FEQAAPAVPMAPAVPRAAAQASVALPEHLDPSSAISRERSVYFTFDNSTITPEQMPLVERHAKYLSVNATLKVRIEGNTDTRGGAEYNLALGQRRAESVARALSLLGAGSNQMEVVSYGEERPKMAGNNESAWAQNRRADLLYPRR